MVTENADKTPMMMVCIQITIPDSCNLCNLLPSAINGSMTVKIPKPETIYSFESISIKYKRICAAARKMAMVSLKYKMFFGP